MSVRNPPSQTRRYAVGVVCVVAIAFGMLFARSGAGNGPHEVQDPSTPPGEQGRARPRLILFYAPCTVNANYLSPYDPAVAYTPNLASLAKDGVVFTRHKTEAGHTSVAYASIMTGTQAPEHGVFAVPTALSDSNYVMAEAFADNGYDTFFWDANLMASSHYDYDQGVSRENVFEGILGESHGDRLRGILKRLKTEQGYTAFLMSYFTVTHEVYEANRVPAFCREFPGECARISPTVQGDKYRRYVGLYQGSSGQLEANFDEAVKKLGLSGTEVLELASVVELLYKANVHHLDTLFGNVLREIRRAGLLDDSLIVFTADHGEVLYRENALFKWGHGWQLAPEVLTVPLIIRAPALRDHAGRYDRVTRSIDVFPTLAGLSGIRIPPERAGRFQGIDLAPALSGADAAPSLEAFFHTALLGGQYHAAMRQLGLLSKFHSGTDPAESWVGVEVGNHVYKYRNLDGEHWGFEVFDHSSDRSETTNLFDSGNPIHRRMAERLVEYHASLVQAWNDLEEKPVVDEEALERLRALGYVE